MPKPDATSPSHRAATSWRAVRRGRLAPLTAAGTGVVLVAVSAVLLLHNRSLPPDFGTMPGGQGSMVAAGPASAVPAHSPSRAPVATPPSPPATTATPSTRPTTSATPATPATTTPAPITGRTPAPTTARKPTPANATTRTRPVPTAAPGASRTTAAPTTRTPPPADLRLIPAQLFLPRFGVRADVLPVTSTDGALAVPEDPQQVGWWTGSALPGSTTGTTVVDGHIDSATRGVGALIHLSELAPGDRVSIVGSTGRTLDYDVVARRVYAKNAGLPSSIFAPGGPERLLLISCGGPFDSARGSYEDNIVVFATPSVD